MDTFFDYNQIRIVSKDEEHATFITESGLHYYKMMPFDLKNANIVRCMS